MNHFSIPAPAERERLPRRGKCPPKRAWPGRCRSLYQGVLCSSANGEREGKKRDGEKKERKMIEEKKREYVLTTKSSIENQCHCLEFYA